MPFGGGKTQTLNISGIAWDADFIVPAARKITVDHIAETTGAHGIVTDQALKPAAGVTGNLTQNADLVIPAAYKVTVDHIAETTGAHGIQHNHKVGIVADAVLSVDHIAEVTGAHNIIADTPLIGAASLILASASDTLQKSDDAPGNTTSPSYVLCKTIVVPPNHRPGGVYRVKATISVAGSDENNPGAYRIYINGVAAGAEHSTTLAGGSLTSSDDLTLTVAAGSQIQLYCKVTNSGAGYQTTYSNFRVYCTQTVSLPTAW